MTKPHPPPRATPARGGGNPAGEELHGTGATRTATVRSDTAKPVARHSSRNETAHTHTRHTHLSVQATGRTEPPARERKRKRPR